MANEIPLAFAVGAALLSIRIGAALRLTPFFGAAPMPTLPWLGLSLSLGILLMSNSPVVSISDIGPPRLIALGVKELFIGVVIGTLIRFAFSVFEIIGEVAHLSSFAVFYEPRQSTLATAYLLLGAGAFFVLGGHHGIIRGLASTVNCASPFEIPGWESFAGAGHDAAVRLFAAAMATAVLISAPIFAAGLFADVIIGVLSRLHSGAALAGAQTLRVVAVQLIVVLSLGLVVTHAVEFLQNSLSSLALCKP